MVAVGECGLDFSKGFPAPEAQTSWFQAQLELALLVQKPLFLHERHAHATFVKMLKNTLPVPNTLPLLVHCFTGTEAEMEVYINMGCYIGLTGHFCKPTAGQTLRSFVHKIPLDRIVVESDAPYMGFPKCREPHFNDKKRSYPNVPTSLPMIVQALAALRHESVHEISVKTTRNAHRFLRLL